MCLIPAAGFTVGGSALGRRQPGLYVVPLSTWLVALTVTGRPQRLGCYAAASSGPAVNGDPAREHHARLGVPIVGCLASWGVRARVARAATARAPRRHGRF